MCRDFLKFIAHLYYLFSQNPGNIPELIQEIGQIN